MRGVLNTITVKVTGTHLPPAVPPMQETCQAMQLTICNTLTSRQADRQGETLWCKTWADLSEVTMLICQEIPRNHLVIHVFTMNPGSTDVDQVNPAWKNETQSKSVVIQRQFSENTFSLQSHMLAALSQQLQTLYTKGMTDRWASGLWGTCCAPHQENKLISKTQQQGPKPQSSCMKTRNATAYIR